MKVCHNGLRFALVVVVCLTLLWPAAWAEQKPGKPADSKLRRNRDLVSAASSGFQQDVLDALAGGADIDYQGEIRWTPLMWAVHGGELSVVRILLQRGANVHLRDKEGNTALHHSVR